jgi:membrane fusion protein, copper/silver efflux system
MKSITKTNIMVLSISLVIGVTLGWLIKPSDHRIISTSDQRTIESSDHQQSNESEIWTCSMHPQVRQSEPGQCPICGMDLIPATSNGGNSGKDPMVLEMSESAVAMASIATSRAKAGDGEGEILLTGKVEADERNVFSITAKFPGRVEKLYVNFTGQAISQGQRLASIYSPELVNAQKELREAASSRGDFPEIYAAAKEKLRLWKLTVEQIAAIENQETLIEEFDVLAERSGIVTQRNIAAGDYIGTGTILFEVVDLSRVWIMLDAFETDLPNIDIGDELSFSAAGIPGETFEANVDFIDPIINPETRAAGVRASTNNSKGLLKPEMFVNAKIAAPRTGDQTTVSIPRTALLWSGKRSIVYVKVPGTEYPSYEMREVTVGTRMGDTYPVLEGLKPGEEIVTNGVFAIDAAAQLSGNYSLLNRPETKTMEVPHPFRKQLTDLAEAYFEVKNALVKDDAQTAIAESKKVKASLDNVDMSLVEGDAHDHWMDLRKDLMEALQGIREDENIESVRKQFKLLSDALLEITESFGLEKEKVYRHYCPMAFGDEGAYWLSEMEAIRNPYFGESMLTCGEVRDTYERGKQVMQKEGPAEMQHSGGHNH